MSNQTIKVTDKVKIKSEDTYGIISDIQHEHNRYQLIGVSGWQYNIGNLKKVTDEQFLEAYKELEDVVVGLMSWHHLTVDRHKDEIKQAKEKYDNLVQALRDGNTPGESAAGLIAWLESTTSFYEGVK